MSAKIGVSMNPAALIAKGFTYEPGKGWVKHGRKPVASTMTDPVTAIPTDNPGIVILPSTDEAKLNKLERGWLAMLRLRHPHTDIFIQGVTLKLGDDCRYTPDFFFIHEGAAFAHETKGFFRDDAKVKIKVAARVHRWCRFILVTRNKGNWVEKQINP